MQDGLVIHFITKYSDNEHRVSGVTVKNIMLPNVEFAVAFAYFVTGRPNARISGDGVDGSVQPVNILVGLGDTPPSQRLNPDVNQIFFGLCLFMNL